jgi:hypothetical protein
MIFSLIIGALFIVLSLKDINFSDYFSKHSDIKKDTVITSVPIIKRNKYFHAKPDSNLIKKQLMVNTDTLAKEIITFINKRRMNEPNTDSKHWDESIQIQIQYSKETMMIYKTKYYPRVLSCREDFLKRNLNDADLDRLYDQPTNPIGIELVANGLLHLAAKLR